MCIQNSDKYPFPTGEPPVVPVNVPFQTAAAVPPMTVLYDAVNVGS